jgi:hypothetical protein
MILADVTTNTGCRVRAFHHEQMAISGDGLMLTLDMEQAGDRRHAEVYLDNAALREIHAGIEKHLGMT